MFWLLVYVGDGDSTFLWCMGTCISNSTASQLLSCKLLLHDYVDFSLITNVGFGIYSITTTWFATDWQATRPQNLLLNGYWYIKIHLHATSTSLCMPDKWANVYASINKKALCQSININDWYVGPMLQKPRMRTTLSAAIKCLQVTTAYFIPINLLTGILYSKCHSVSCCVALMQHVRMWPVFLIRYREQNLLCSLGWLSVMYRSLQPLCFNVVL
jgi:hypothetical protein